MGYKSILALLLVLALMAGCTKTAVVELNQSTVQYINDTKIVRNESRYIDAKEKEEGLKAVPPETQEWLCTESVLVGKRSCEWSKENPENLEIAIKNSGYLNVTMAFYFYDADDKKIGDAYNDTVLQPKEEWVFAIPFSEMEAKYGNITNIHATPLLVEESSIMSCTNKILPILVESCG